MIWQSRIRRAALLLLLHCATVSFLPAQEDTKGANLERLKRRADAVLDKSYVNARSEVQAVFDYSDALFAAGQDTAGVEYVRDGLKVYSWNFGQQMTLADALLRLGKDDEAKGVAEMVASTAEDGALIERAKGILGVAAEPSFEAVSARSFTGPGLVLVPMQGCETWLILRIRDGLAEALGIPVSIQTIDVTYPPPHRDRSKLLAKDLRWKLKLGMRTPDVANTMRDLEMKAEDLDEDANVFKLYAHLLARQEGKGSAKSFEEKVKKGFGVNSQWDAAVLRTLLKEKASPFRSGGVAYLAITSEDIYTEDYNFLFGHAGNNYGVMSYHRFRADYNDETPSQERLVKRTLTQCLASSCRVFGLERCTNPTCASAYPESLEEHDAKKAQLCRVCLGHFDEVFGRVKPTPSPAPAP